MTPVNIQNNDEDNQDMSMLERPQSSSTPKSNNKQRNISKEEQPYETPSSYSSRPTTSAEQEKRSSEKDQKQIHSDESIKENNNDEHVPDDVPEGGVNLHNEYIDNDGQASKSNPNTSTLSQDSNAQSSSLSEISDAEFEKIFKGEINYNNVSDCMYIYYFMN